MCKALTTFVLMLAADVVPHRYALVWDNTQKLVVSRDQTRTKKNQMMLWANAYAAKNRVASSAGKSVTSQSTLEACDISLTSFLPSSDDVDLLRERMVQMVSQILVAHINYFAQNCSSAVVRHVTHAHSSESAVKTQLVIFFNVHLMLCVSKWFHKIASGS